jgi:hypothetical protein
MLFVDDAQPLPTIPADLARRHRAHYRLDTPFRAAARLQQALWLARQPLPEYPPFDPDQIPHLTARLGAKLATDDICRSRNFLSPDVLVQTARELVYAERGALMDERRVLTNPISSSALCYNIGSFLKLHPDLAHRFVECVFPGHAGQISLIIFEHNPGRGDPTLTADGSAFDLAIYLRRPDGTRTFIGIEVKFTEGMNEPEAEHRPRYDEIAASSGLYRNPDAPALRKSPVQQLFREHLLCQAMVDSGLVDDALYVLLAPELNTDVQRAAACYRSLLAHTPGKVAFMSVGLGRAVQAIRSAGAITYADQLHDRYGSFIEVREAVASFLAKEMECPSLGERT